MANEPQSLVQRVYAAINDGDPTVFDLLDSDIEWITPDSLPWTLPGSDGCYRGHAVLGEYFMRCLAEVDDLHVEVTDLLTVGDRVLALGFECGRSRRTGHAFRARFAQLWTTRKDKVTRLEGFPDTAVMVAAFQAD